MAMSPKSFQIQISFISLSAFHCISEKLFIVCSMFYQSRPKKTLNLADCVIIKVI